MPIQMSLKCDKTENISISFSNQNGMKLEIKWEETENLIINRTELYTLLEQPLDQRRNQKWSKFWEKWATVKQGCYSNKYTHLKRITSNKQSNCT